MTQHIVIIGGGAAGLGAAYALKAAQKAGADITFDVFEQDKRFGGKVSGETVPDPETGEPWLIDGGPDCFSAYKPAPSRIATELGFIDDLLPADDSRKGTYICRDGRPLHLPQGFSMFIPTELAPLFETELLSEQGKKEALSELFVPPKELAPGEFNDESLESFIMRRFGREILDYFAEPFIGGVHAGDPKTMSLAASFPQYLEMEQKYGSLIKGTVLTKAARERAQAAHPDRKPVPVFATFTGGLQELTDALQHAIGTEHLHANRRTVSLEFADVAAGGASGYSVCFEQLEPQIADPLAAHPGDVDPHPPLVIGTERHTADAVIIATESFAAAPLIRAIDAEVADCYAAIPASSSATASFAFDEAELNLGIDGFGLLVPEAEQRNLLALTFSSFKWKGHAPKGRVLLRGFIGTPLNQKIMEKSDAELEDIILGEIRDILDISPEARPLFTRFYRWTRGMSQYTLGHIERVQTIEEHVARIAGLGVAGGCFHGIGVPNCIDSGEAAAKKVLTDLGRV